MVKILVFTALILNASPQALPATDTNISSKPNEACKTCDNLIQSSCSRIPGNPTKPECCQKINQRKNIVSHCA